MREQKPYDDLEYIDDVFAMCRMQTWDERIEQASKICDHLRYPMTIWQCRWIERAMIAAVAFLLGQIIGSFA